MALVKIYIFLDQINTCIQVGNHNFWHSCQEEPKVFTTDYASYRLLDSLEVEYNDQNWNPTETKISALETKLSKDLADSYVRQENLKAQIQELKCIGHENDERMRDKILGDEDYFEPNGGVPPSPVFDDDIPS